MEISRIRALRGPNLWTPNTAIEAVVSCSDQECDISRLPGFEDRLRRRFPALGALQPIGNTVAVPMAHALGMATLDLQIQAGCPVTFRRTTPTVQSGVFQVVVAYSQEEVGRLALELAQTLCESALDDTPFDVAAALEQLRELDEDVRLGPSTGAIVDAALARGIPVRRMTQGSMVMLGWGSRQRRIQAAEIDATSAIAEAIAQDKQLTKKLLDAAGVPVPHGRAVSSEDDAWLAAQEIGKPVVVKPKDGNQGKGVTVNITAEADVRRAYQTALKFGRRILVEQFIHGHDYRLLVVGDKLVAAARREPPLVVGDGEQTIRALVDEVNKDPRRGSGHATSLTRIRFDDIALACLANQGLNAQSVPALGQRVVLRHNANLSTGGTATDVTDDVHPQLAARAVEAAQMVGLHICGVDVVTDSIHHSLEARQGGIVEVNAAPGLRMHIAPSYGKGRAVGEAVIQTLFGDKGNGRIPVVAVTGTNGKTTTVRLIAHLLTQHGLGVGMTSTDGVYVKGERIDTGDCSGPKSARNILQHPEVDAAVLETARGGMLREGLAYDRCDVAVVTNVGGGDHLGLNYITTLEDLAVLKRVVVQNIAPTGTAVLNATDPNVVAMAAHCPGKVCYFCQDRHHPVMAQHLALGLNGVYVDNGHIVAALGDRVNQLELAAIPLTLGGSIGFQVDNVMAAVACAWTLGLPWSTIRDGLASFDNDQHNAQGRFNVMNYHGATLIADYGHNPDAIEALIAAVQRMPGQRRTVVISGAGDRRDQDIRQQTELLGEAFDTVVLYQDQCQRGRADGEVLALLRQGLTNASRTRQILEIHGEFKAIDTALAQLETGDLCLILVDQVEEAMAHLRQRVAQAHQG